MTKDWDSEDWEEADELAPEERIKQIQDQKSRLYYGELNDNGKPPKEALDLDEGDRFLDEYNRVWAVSGGQWKLQGFGDPDNKVPTSFFDDINAEIFNVKITYTNDPISAGSTLEVDAEIKNAGVRGSQDVKLHANGEVQDTQNVDLNTDSSTTITLEWEIDAKLEGGNYDVTVSTDDDEDTKTVEISSTVVFDVTITDTNSPIEDEEDLKVDAQIENLDSEQDTQIIELVNDGDVKDSYEMTLGANNSSSLRLVWSNARYGEYTVTMRSDHEKDSVNIKVNNPPTFNVTISDTNSPVSTGGDLNVEATVKNESSDLSDTQTITLDADGGQKDSESVSLDPEVETTVTLTWSGPSPGNYTATISSELDSDSTSVKVNDSGPYYDVIIANAPSQVSESGTFDVDITVDNVGDSADTQDITLDISDGVGVVDTQSDVSLGQDESTSFTLTWNSPSQGEYTATISSSNDSETHEFEVYIEDAYVAIVKDTVDSKYQTQAGQLFEIRFQVSNVSNGSGTGTIEMLNGNEQLDSKTIEMEDQEKRYITLSWQTSKSDAGNYTITLKGFEDEFDFKGFTNELDFTLTLTSLGDANAGIIIHTSSGKTLEGDQVNAESWVEIYGNEIHTSEI